MSNQGSTVVGVVVAILIVGAVATLGYYQFEVAPGLTSTTATGTSTSTTAAVNCSTAPSKCVNVTIISGAVGCTAPACTVGSGAPYGYDPPSFKVVIGVNNTVVWTNQDSAFHTATEMTGPSGTSFDSGCLDGVGAPCPSGLGSGTSTFQYTFTVPGTYTYHCTFHSWMIGKITVVQDTG